MSSQARRKNEKTTSLMKLPDYTKRERGQGERGERQRHTDRERWDMSEWVERETEGRERAE